VSHADDLRAQLRTAELQANRYAGTPGRERLAEMWAEHAEALADELARFEDGGAA